MATNYEFLKQQVDPLERKVKTLLNHDLRQICKSEGLQISGVKSTLQGRILERLNDTVTSGDGARFNELRQKILSAGPDAHPHNSQAPLLASTYTPMSNGYPAPRTDSGHGPHRAGAGHSHGNRSYPPRLNFRSSPFYTPLEHLTTITDLPTMNSNRHTITSRFTLSATNIERFRADKSLRVMLYCAVDPGNSHAPSDIAFPSQVEVKVNNEVFHGNLRGIKKRPGTTRPADVTDFVRKYQANVQNQVSITYAATDKRFLFVVDLVQKHSVEELVAVIRKGHIISKNSVLDEMRERAKDSDVMATSTVMSLKCPLSTLRMQLPCRSTLCSHNQCFDATSFLQVQEQAPQWSCPICNKTVQFSALAVDGYVQEILAAVPKSVEQVTIEPDGTWKQGAREEEFKPPSTGTKRKHSETVDFEDVVELYDHRTNSLRKETAYSTPQSIARTPAASSREASTAASTAQRSSGGKRAAAEVIDLTLSDDDEPPQPVKRQSAGSFGQHPNARPEPPIPSPQPYNQYLPQNTINPANLNSPTLSSYGQLNSFPSRPSSGFSFTLPSHQHPPLHQSYAHPSSPNPPFSPGYGGWR